MLVAGLLDRRTQVLQQMPSISDLDRLWRGLPGVVAGLHAQVGIQEAALALAFFETADQGDQRAVGRDAGEVAQSGSGRTAVLVGCAGVRQAVVDGADAPGVGAQAGGLSCEGMATGQQQFRARVPQNEAGTLGPQRLLLRLRLVERGHHRCVGR